MYFRRICSGVRRKQPFRGAYDIVRRDSISFKVMTDDYRLKVAARYKGMKPKNGKFGYQANPKLLTPRKSFSQIIGMKLPSLDPKDLLKKKEEKQEYILPPEYAAPKIAAVKKKTEPEKVYLGSELEGKIEYARPKEEEAVVIAKKEEKPLKPASVDETVEGPKVEKDYNSMAELSFLIYVLSKNLVKK